MAMRKEKVGEQQHHGFEGRRRKTVVEEGCVFMAGEHLSDTFSNCMGMRTQMKRSHTPSFSVYLCHLHQWMTPSPTDSNMAGEHLSDGAEGVFGKWK